MSGAYGGGLFALDGAELLDDLVVGLHLVALELGDDNLGELEGDDVGEELEGVDVALVLG